MAGWVYCINKWSGALRGWIWNQPWANGCCFPTPTRFQQWSGYKNRLSIPLFAGTLSKHHPVMTLWLNVPRFERTTMRKENLFNSFGKCRSFVSRMVSIATTSFPEMPRRSTPLVCWNVGCQYQGHHFGPPYLSCNQLPVTATDGFRIAPRFLQQFCQHRACHPSVPNLSRCQEDHPTQAQQNGAKSGPVSLWMDVGFKPRGQ